MNGFEYMELADELDDAVESWRRGADCGIVELGWPLLDGETFGIIPAWNQRGRRGCIKKKVCTPPRVASRSTPECRMEFEARDHPELRLRWIDLREKRSRSECTHVEYLCLLTVVGCDCDLNPKIEVATSHLQLERLIVDTAGRQGIKTKFLIG